MAGPIHDPAPRGDDLPHLDTFVAYLRDVLDAMREARDLKDYRFGPLSAAPGGVSAIIDADLSGIGMPVNSVISVRAASSEPHLTWTFDKGTVIARTPREATASEAAAALDMVALLDAFAAMAGPSIDLATVTFAYSRAQAIADGVLVDVTETAKQAGFTVPVALTAAVVERYVFVPPGVMAQDPQGRLWDLCTMLRYGIAQAQDRGGRELRFSLHVRNDNREGIPPLVELKCLSGPGDHGEHVLTVMLPEED